MSDPKTASFGFRDVPEAEKEGLVREVFSSVAARYDLMNDLMSARHPPHLEGRDGGMAEPAAGLAGAGCGGRHRRHRLSHRRDGARAAAAKPTITVCDINADMLGEGVRRAEEKGETAIAWVVRRCREAAVAGRAVRRLYHRLRHPQCHPYRRARWPKRGGC